jgi:predicted phosphodiesterase
MKIGIVSDTHGMHTQLAHALTQMSHCHVLVNLGDIVGYNGDANQCMKVLASRQRVVNVIGNHDLEALSAHRLPVTERRADYGLTQENLTLLKSWPLAVTLRIGGEGYRFCHSHHFKENKFVHFDRVDEYNAEEVLQDDIRYCFIGHTHVPRLMTWESGVFSEQELFASKKFHLAGEAQYIINVGSIANDNYAIFDTYMAELAFVCPSLYKE